MPELTAKDAGVCPHCGHVPEPTISTMLAYCRSHQGMAERCLEGWLGRDVAASKLTVKARLVTKWKTWADELESLIEGNTNG